MDMDPDMLIIHRFIQVPYWWCVEGNRLQKKLPDFQVPSTQECDTQRQPRENGRSRDSSCYHESMQTSEGDLDGAFGLHVCGGPGHLTRPLHRLLGVSEQQVLQFGKLKCRHGLSLSCVQWLLDSTEVPTSHCYISELCYVKPTSVDNQITLWSECPSETYPLEHPYFACEHEMQQKPRI